jgi:MarR family 2-MHQ and catechol resistance regulon transcriptional repressor
MNILEAIKQKSFDSSFEKAVVNLLYTYNWYRDKYQDIYKASNLKIQHYNVLRILKGSKPKSISPGEIKEVMIDKSPDLTRLLDKLVEKGLVDRNLCPQNRRKMDVLITKEGENILKQITRKQQQLQKEQWQHFTEEEAEQLSNLLDKFRS